jgi:hypothetical protein
MYYLKWDAPISAGLVVKAMILNGLGFTHSPLYLFSQFFEPVFRTSPEKIKIDSKMATE